MGPGCAALVRGQWTPQEGTLPRFSAPEGGEAGNPVGERDGRSWAGGRVSHGDQIFRMNHGGPKPVSTPLHLQALQRANRESKPGHPHPRDKSPLGREHSSQAWLQDPTGQIFIKSKRVGEGSKAFPFVMNSSRCLLSSVFGHTEVIS